MDMYILTFENGTHTVTTEITQDIIEAVLEGYITVIRCSDAKMLDGENTWVDIKKEKYWV